MNSLFFAGVVTFKRCLVSLQNRLVIAVVIFGFFSKSPDDNFLRFGSAYGGWHVDAKLLKSKGKKLLISAGLGHDVSFDIEMLKQGFVVIGLDPLRSSIEFASEALSEFGSSVELINAGLWTESGNIRFYPPLIQDHDSWSILNVQESNDSLGTEFPVLDLNSLAESKSDFNDFSVRILKLDIEGAEVDLFDSISNFNPPFDQVSIEMDFLSLVKFRQLSRRMKEIKRARKALFFFNSRGYNLENYENFNFTWVFRN